MQTVLMSITNENVVGFDKVGYQKKIPVVSSFAEFIGEQAISTTTDDTVGRLVKTNNPLDIALAEKGYFQVLNSDGSLELTRDGRFKIDKNGSLLTQLDQKVLSSAGLPIVLPFVPSELNKIKIGLDGKIGVLDEEKRGFVQAGTIGVVCADGSKLIANGVRQGYVESSNVQLEKEYLEIVNYKRSFDANRQMFKLQNNNLSNAIQTLGRV
jgi:flagellar basal body rod protein FlgG